MTLSTPLLLYILGGLVLVLIGFIIHLELRVKKLLLGRDAASLEDTIGELDRRTGALDDSRKEIERYLAVVERRLKRAVSGVETVRFNPFKGSSGSNQSFATAFLSEEGNGVVISTLYSRDHVSVFGKPVVGRASSYELTQEEREAIAKASLRK